MDFFEAVNIISEKTKKSKRIVQPLTDDYFFFQGAFGKSKVGDEYIESLADRTKLRQGRKLFEELSKKYDEAKEIAKKQQEKVPETKTISAIEKPKLELKGLDIVPIPKSPIEKLSETTERVKGQTKELQSQMNRLSQKARDIANRELKQSPFKMIIPKAEYMDVAPPLFGRVEQEGDFNNFNNQMGGGWWAQRPSPININPQQTKISNVIVGTRGDIQYGQRQPVLQEELQQNVVEEELTEEEELQRAVEEAQIKQKSINPDWEYSQND